MILLTVLSFNGASVAGLAASFDELGGSIGRADHNQLVLPDPERSISRVHAKIVFRAGGYVVVDNGSNPIVLNGKPLDSGSEQPLKAGDKLQIGAYLLDVSDAVQGGSSDPFADLFGDLGGNLVAGAASAQVLAPRVAAGQAAAAWPQTPAWPPAAAAPHSPAAGQIPQDWDPFAVETEPLRAPGLGIAGPAGAPASPRAELSFGSGGMESLDDLFGLSGHSAGADPLGAAPAQALLLQPNMAAHADPLQSLGRPALIAAQSSADHGSELNTPFTPAPLAAAPRDIGATGAPAPAIPSSAIFSWDEPVVTAPPGPPSRPQPVVAATPMPVGAAATATATATAPVPAPAPAAAAATAAAEPALLAALLEGLASPGLRIDALTPELMRLIGVLLRESTRGTVELLVARAALKREMRAEVTIIVARENNPLKFSPSAEVALQYLLAPPMPGFMKAAPAMRDAFDDLRAHQLGVMAGMKAALGGVLQRFDPQQLEAKLTAKSAISSLLPALRKARLWELFQDLFGQLSDEAADDFDELFGKAFVRAYEAQLDRLAAEPGPT